MFDWVVLQGWSALLFWEGIEHRTGLYFHSFYDEFWKVLKNRLLIEITWKSSKLIYFNWIIVLQGMVDYSTLVIVIDNIVKLEAVLYKHEFYSWITDKFSIDFLIMESFGNYWHHFWPIHVFEGLPTVGTLNLRNYSLVGQGCAWSLYWYGFKLGTGIGEHHWKQVNNSFKYWSVLKWRQILYLCLKNHCMNW